MKQLASASHVLEEAFELSDEILKDIELSRISLSAIALKTSRLARLQNDFEFEEIFNYEANGYPTTPDGVSPSIFKLLRTAKRVTLRKKKDKTEEVANLSSIGALEVTLQAQEIRLSVTRDPDFSISSSNPNQHVLTSSGNREERQGIIYSINEDKTTLESRRAFIHKYVSKTYYQLKYSSQAEDIFTRVRLRVDQDIGNVVPDAVKKFTAVNDNLVSENPEDWANAVHGCRRILQALADALFPPCADRENGKKLIKLGPDNYINRLVCFADDNSSSSRYKDLIGSHLGFLGDRLDAVFKAAQKGSHSAVSKAEADRYVMYTYMLVSDIISLKLEENP